MRIIGIASDHAGYSLKQYLKEILQNNYELKDFGANSEKSCDYADYAHLLARSIIDGSSNIGIAICGSGIGISLTLNRHPHIRAALCWTPEVAELARKHNDANVLVLPGRFVDKDYASSIFQRFITTDFERGRHLSRIRKIELA